MKTHYLFNAALKMLVVFRTNANGVEATRIAEKGAYRPVSLTLAHGRKYWRELLAKGFAPAFEDALTVNVGSN